MQIAACGLGIVIEIHTSALIKLLSHVRARELVSARDARETTIDPNGGILTNVAVFIAIIIISLPKTDLVACITNVQSRVVAILGMTRKTSR